MKKSGTKKNSMLTVSVAFVLVTGLFSCSGNSGNTSDGKEGDNANRADTITNVPNNAQDQTYVKNDSIATPNITDDNSGAVDTTFMMKAAEINMEEIKLGKLAQQKGTMSHVKALGKMMVTEHTQAMATLKAMAKAKTANIPTAESEKIMADYTMLKAKAGKDFDLAYSEMMVKGHKEAIALFEKTNSETKDAEVKAMTASMIPKLKTHLEHAEMCQKECEKM